MMSASGNQYIILSLPSCGTDWLATCIQKTHPELRYHREFFNPICNLEHAETLGQAFGCEMIPYHKRIAVPWRNQFETISDAYLKTWPGSGLNFTKENFSAFKVGFFAGVFKCIGVLRPVHAVFPPPRLRVVAWYNAIFDSIRGYVDQCGNFNDGLVGRIVTNSLREARTPLERAVAAFVISSIVLTRGLLDNDSPLLEYSSLVQLRGGDLWDYLKRNLPEGIDVDALAAEIEITADRSFNLADRIRKFNALGLNEFLLRIEAV